MTVSEIVELTTLLIELGPRTPLPWVVEDSKTIGKAVVSNYIGGTVVAYCPTNQAAVPLISAAVNALPHLLRERKSLVDALEDLLKWVDDPRGLPEAPNHHCGPESGGCDGGCVDYAYFCEVLVRARMAIITARESRKETSR
jgi:hypothetical protein